jgi:hypothetical protein
MMLLLHQGLDACAEEYQRIYVPEMEQLRKEKEEREAARKQVSCSGASKQTQCYAYLYL